jgi:PPOX class probable F420-dependent enzyme
MTEPQAQRPAMKAYGVPDELEGVLPWSWAEERLARCRNFFVVTASSDARPHVMPVWGVWRPDPGAFLFSADGGSRKIRNLRANPQVAVAVDDSVEVVVVEGRAEVVEGSDVEDGLVAYAVKYWDEPKQQVESVAFLKENEIVVVTPERAFGIIEDEVDFSQRATRWVWS